jgi:hypothetical protein
MLKHEACQNDYNTYVVRIPYQYQCKKQELVRAVWGKQREKFDNTP